MIRETTNTAKVGAFVLETLTTGMYTNPLDALREYVQNSFDSIQNGVRSQCLVPSAGRIEIFIDEKKRGLRIHDNGPGISETDVVPRLINIGMSAKTLGESAGFRGIGRLAGIAYCQRLIFRTRSQGERALHEVAFRCNDLRKSMSPTKRQTDEVADVLQRHTEVKTQKTQNADSFFEVIMEDITPEGQVFLEWQKIHAYLAQVAPVRFDTNSFRWTGDIYQWMKSREITLPEVSLLLHAGKVRQEVFKPYQKSTYKTKTQNLNINLRGVRFFPEDASAKSPFWLWYADTNLPGMFDDDTVAGLRLRKKNIALGMDERMTEIFGEVSDSNARFNSYLLGEIHVQDPATVPNARRDGFEDGAAWTEIRSSLITFAQERSREIRDASKDRNMDIEKLLRPIEQQIGIAEKKQSVGFASKAERDDLLASLDKGLEKLGRAGAGGRKEQEVERINQTRDRIAQTKQKLQEARYISQKLNTALDRKQRKIVSEILELLHEVLDAPDFERAREAIVAKYSIQADDENDGQRNKLKQKERKA